MGNKSMKRQKIGAPNRFSSNTKPHQAIGSSEKIKNDSLIKKPGEGVGNQDSTHFKLEEKSSIG
jgi:hypothetical protein